MFHCIDHPTETAQSMTGPNFPRCPICGWRMIRGDPGSLLMADLHNAGVPMKDLIRATEEVGGYKKEFEGSELAKQVVLKTQKRNVFRLLWATVKLWFWIALAAVLIPIARHGARKHSQTCRHRNQCQCIDCGHQLKPPRS